MTTEDIPLEKMSTSEKLRLLEALWADLSRCEDNIPAPDWHGQILEERDQLIREGNATFSDWEEAKRRIREATQ